MGKKHRANGEGTVFKRPNGQGWQGQATIDGKRRSFYGRTQAATLEKLKAARAAAGAGTLTAEPNLTVGEYLERWIEGRHAAVEAGDLEYSTWADNRQVLRSHAIPTLGHLRLLDLKAHHIDTLLTGARRVGTDKPLSSATRKRVRSTLRVALHTAEGSDLVTRNAARLSTAIPQRQPEVEPFSMSDARKLVAAAERIETGAPFLLGLLVGLREGEILGLLWENLDLAAGVLKVRTHLTRSDGRFVLGDLKTHQRSHRDVMLPPRLVELLRRHQAKQAADKLAAGDRWRPRFDLVFTTSTGGPIEKTNFIRRQWRPFLRAAGVAYRTFHTTRHTAASVALSAEGATLSSVSRALGHQSERTTQDTYAHSFTKLHGAVSNAVADALFAP